MARSWGKIAIVSIISQIRIILKKYCGGASTVSNTCASSGSSDLVFLAERNHQVVYSVFQSRFDRQIPFAKNLHSANIRK